MYDLCKLEESKEEMNKTKVWMDADWTSPRSTSGWVITWQSVIMQAISRTQSTPALSSAKAEVIAAGEAVKEATWLEHVVEEIEGEEITVEVHCDATTAIGLMKRRGVGRVKHLELRQLWIQEQVEAGRVVVEKVSTEENPADMFTNPLGDQRLQMLTWKIGMRDEDEVEMI